MGACICVLAGWLLLLLQYIGILWYTSQKSSWMESKTLPCYLSHMHDFLLVHRKHLLTLCPNEVQKLRNNLSFVPPLERIANQALSSRFPKSS